MRSYFKMQKVTDEVQKMWFKYRLVKGRFLYSEYLSVYLYPMLVIRPHFVSGISFSFTRWRLA